MDGMVLTFHLAGINNQNFLMRDEQTGSYWQQVSGRAVAGPLKGRQLRLVHSDELTFGLYRAERPEGEVLRADPNDEAKYSPIDWEKQFEKMPVVVEHPGEGFESKDVMLTISAFGEDRAYALRELLAEKLIQDRVGGHPVIVVLGPDGDSVRAFRIPATEFYRTAGSDGALLMDAATGGRWNFRGCRIDDGEKRECLEALTVTRDYWFDWRSYHPQGTVYRRPAR